MGNLSANHPDGGDDYAEVLQETVMNPNFTWTVKVLDVFPPYNMTAFVFECLQTGIRLRIDHEEYVHVIPFGFTLSAEVTAKMREKLVEIAKSSGYYSDASPKEAITRVVSGEMPYRVDMKPGTFGCTEAQQMWEFLQNNAKTWHATPGFIAVFFQDEQEAATFKVMYSKWTM